MVAPESKEMVAETYRLRMSGEKEVPNRYDTKVLCKDGTIIEVEVSARRFQYQGKPASLGFLHDITERKRFEAAMKLKEKELTQRKFTLQKLNRELMETNQALSILARNIDGEKELLEQKIFETISTNIIPIIIELQDDKRFQKRLVDLELLKTYLNGLIPGPTDQQEMLVSLSRQEIRVAVMIRNDLTSQQIADLLCLSLLTVKTHRKHIRKKLKINNKNINLVSYLKSKLKSDPFQGSKPYRAKVEDVAGQLSPTPLDPDAKSRSAGDVQG